jgi:hypothetical protein
MVPPKTPFALWAALQILWWLGPGVSAGFCLGVPGTSRSSPIDYQMPPSGQVTVAASGGLRFPIRINGNKPVTALFDTGGVNQISSELAQTLGLRVSSDPVKFGAIGGNTKVETTTIDRISIGGLTLHHQTFYVMHIPPGVDAPQLVMGWELMLRVVVRIDVEKNEISFIQEPQFRYRGSGTPVRLIMRNDNTGADLRAMVDGAPGEFLLDTGNEKGFFLNASFVAKNHLMQKLKPRYAVYNGRGYGGLAPKAYLARLGTLQIGDIRIADALVRLQTAPDGPWRNDGNIGESILDRFNLVIDCGRHVVYFERTARWDKREVFNRAGLIFSIENHVETVMTVLPNSAGAKGGVQVGDQIVDIDGLAPSSSAHDPAFYQPPGTVVQMHVRRQGAIVGLRLVLEDSL